MRIFYLCYENFQESKGGTRHVIEVVRQLGQLGHKVDLFIPTPAPQGFFKDKERITVYPIPAIPLRIVRWLTFYTISALLVLIVGWRTRPDVIYIREMVYNLWPLLVSRLLGAPLVVEVNGLLLDEVAMVGVGAIEQGMIRCSQGIVFRMTDRIVTVIEGIKRWITEEYGIAPETITVIPNGTNQDVFSPSKIETARGRIGLPSDVPIVGFIGSCYPYHDVPSLIEAGVHIRSIQSDIKFVIVGDGSMRMLWMKLAEERGVEQSFLFTGRVSYEDIPAYINAFTVCVAPFAKELNRGIGSPIKLYEYMACGKAVIVSGTPEIWHVLEEHDCGIVVPFEDPERLAEAILLLLREKDLREEMGRRGREAVLRFYTWERVARDIVEVCREAIEG